MKLLIITFSTNDTNAGLLHLKRSMEHNGYDFKVLVDEKFSWGGDNYKTVAEWLKENRADYTHILYTDAWDTLAMAPLAECVTKYGIMSPNGLRWIYSAEKKPVFRTG